jgi:hypothetical protein
VSRGGHGARRGRPHLELHEPSDRRSAPRWPTPDARGRSREPHPSPPPRPAPPPAPSPRTPTRSRRGRSPSGSRCPTRSPRSRTARARGARARAARTPASTRACSTARPPRTRRWSPASRRQRTRVRVVSPSSVTDRLGTAGKFPSPSRLPQYLLSATLGWATAMASSITGPPRRSPVAAAPRASPSRCAPPAPRTSRSRRSRPPSRPRARRRPPPPKPRAPRRSRPRLPR